MVSVAGLQLIPRGTAYGLLIGLGILFCVVILAAVRIQKSYLSEDSGTSEMFLVANRSIALMAALGVMAKIRVPYAHTSLEIIKQRYGKIGHSVFIVMNLINNVFGCASMILTGSQLVYGVSGMHFVAACIIIPFGVGGLKATFLTDFLHTLVALILIIYFTLSILHHDAIGGLYGLWDKVMATASENIIPGNYKGSLLTMKSRDAIIWGLDLKFGNLALVVMDTAFWQKSFATEVNATVPGYNLAALAIFGIPWGLGTVIGLAARAIHNTPIFPTFPGEFTAAEVSAGFVMPYTIKALIGDQGVIAFLVLVFMALTSTVSSSMIAVSSILSFDVYKTYLNPRATDKKLVKVSHLTVILHGVFMSGIAIALNYGGANMTWLGYLRPVVSCPGIIPLALTLGWSRQTRLAAVVSPVLGFFTGLGIWLGTAYHLYGTVTIESTQNPLPALYGAIGSFFSPALYSVLISLYKPSKFDWREFLRIELADEAILHREDEKLASPSSGSDDEKKVTDSVLKADGTDHGAALTKSAPADEPTLAAGRKVAMGSPEISNSPSLISLDDVQHPFDEATLQKLRLWERIAWVFFVVIVLVTFVLWPMPLYRDYIFTKSFFSGWTTVAIVWQFFAFGAVVVFPVWDGRHAIAKGARGVWRAIGTRSAKSEA
ncbi:hypothetical protein SLS63_007271 [Diaporthe eres]|uniref:Urea active transporter n=1 Tax=Diaporthe eres TaxID=83184 RepID=A0ABR1P5Z1_DIAER